MGPLQCKLTIFKDGEGKGKVKYEVIPDTNLVQIEGDLSDDHLTKDTVKMLNRFIGERPELCEQEHLQLLGRYLYHILFDGNTTADGVYTGITLGKRFIDTYGLFERDFAAGKSQTGRDPDFRFRVTLIFEEGMDVLAGYPWEFLYITRPSATGFFLAGQKAELILTRFVEKLGTPQLLPADEKLIILVAWAQPKELGPVNEFDTVTAIETLAKDIENKLKEINIEVISFPQATHAGLKSMIEINKPHIVHFIGHGEIRRDGKNVIALMKTQEQIALDKADMICKKLPGEPEQAHWVDSDSIRALFISNPPRLVFLHACNSAKALESFKSAAEQVLRANVPFVVAMQYEISNEDATYFAKTFYKKLGEGMSIDEAVKSGRNELGQKAPSWGHPRFGTPIVYLQSEDSVIVKKKIISPPPPVSKHPCPYDDCPKIVSPDQKRCACEKKYLLKQCPQCGKANTIDAIGCGFRDCNHVFDTEQSQVSAPTVQGTAAGPADIFSRKPKV